jgi:hypothetical protein
MRAAGCRRGPGSGQHLTIGKHERQGTRYCNDVSGNSVHDGRTTLIAEANPDLEAMMSASLPQTNLQVVVKVHRRHGAYRPGNSVVFARSYCAVAAKGARPNDMVAAELEAKIDRECRSARRQRSVFRVVHRRQLRAVR